MPSKPSNRRSILRTAHRDAMTAALKLGRAMPGQYEGFRRELFRAQERFERAVRRYVAT